jgi:FtsP/CotA-like multicopper oxidase with cupredoxin domain/uncharacterized membrane protein
MSTSNGPYLGTDATDSDDPGGGTPELETTLIASRETVNIGGGILANAEVFNGEIPGPTFRLTVGDTVVVRLVNDLPYPTGIHWHGLELENYADGTEVTQDAVPGAPLQVLGNGTPAGGTYLYKFKVPRAGLFWYHPHHHNGMNQTFRGMYGLIVVTDPLEASLVGGVLPAAADTMQLVLGDITVCKGAGSTDPTYLANYVDPATIMPVADQPEWLSGASAQTGFTPQELCELPTAMDDEGAQATANYLAGDVPSIVRDPGPLVEGQTVLTNGVNVGGRLGKPAAPGALAAGAVTKDVLSGQGLRLQIVNCATHRYFRLRLMADGNTLVPLFRIGGEGGLLDKPILEGGTTATFNTGFDSGEILLPPGTRADVVAAIPAGLPLNSVLTLWTRDYQRVGSVNPSNWSQLPSVPVMHLKVVGAAGTAYTIDDVNTVLRATAGMPAVETLGTATAASLLDPAAIGDVGSADEEIEIQTNPGGPATIDGVMGMFMGSPHYTDAMHLAGSTRFAAQSTGGQPTELELTVRNTSSAHHPFHLHGFSFQPKTYEQGVPLVPVFTWTHQEFRDTVDVPPATTLRFRVRLDDRELADGATPGGALGRWMFHCHIFSHGHHGMMSELVVTGPGGEEKPNVNVGGSWAYAPIGGTATRQGTFHHPDGLNMGLTASKGTVLPAGPSAGGNWSWSFPSAPGDPASFDYVYITATDSAGRQDQAVFRLQLGGADTGSDVGDPHLRTVDGTRYDFQAAGEFILLRDRDGMEIQVRQTPVQTPPPVTDAYTGLQACVSLNTAVAARVGSHRIAYQPYKEPGRVQFLLDGKPADLPDQGIDLEGHRVTAYAAGNETGLRVDYAHGPVLMVTPRFWASYGLSYLDVSVSNTNGDEGIMGRIPRDSWLPALPSGATVGPMPTDLHDRYVTLYQTFADAWRVTDQTSLFVYTPRKSTATFTDRNWPPEKPPCTLKFGFPKPVTPILENIEIAKAEQICGGVTEKDLFDNCVFDVATTGDETFAGGYLVSQELRLHSSAVQVVSDKPQTEPGESLMVTATVLPLRHDNPTPKGTVTFLVDGKETGPPLELDEQGRAAFTIERLERGVHRIRAAYVSRGNHSYAPSSSPNLLHAVGHVEEEDRRLIDAGDHTTGVPSTAAIAGHPIHPMLIPFPIAFLLAAFVSDVGFWWTGDPFWARASLWLVGVGFLTGVAAAVFGLIDFWTIERAREHRIGWVHAIGNGAVLVLALASVLLRRGDPVAAVVPWGLTLTGVIAILLVVTGWAGGDLAHRHLIGVTGHGPDDHEPGTGEPGIGEPGTPPVDGDHHSGEDRGRATPP